MTGIMIKSADVWIRVSSIQRKVKQSELCYVACKSGSTRMAYEEFTGEWEALNLEGCVGLGYQTQLGLEEPQRVLIMIDIPDSEARPFQGGCDVSGGVSETMNGNAYSVVMNPACRLPKRGAA